MPAVPPACTHLRTQGRRGKETRDAFARVTSGAPARHTRKRTAEGARKTGSGFTLVRRLTARASGSPRGAGEGTPLGATGAA